MSNLLQSIKRACPDWMLAIVNHSRSHGVFPNVLSPLSFNQKILHRILFDRRALLTQLADKAAVRCYVEARLGSQILPKLYHLTTDLDSIPFDELPQNFVVKPTHGSGWVEIVTDKTTLDREKLIATCRSWLKQSYYKISREWVYKNIQPQILIEEFIDGGAGQSPDDYKLFVFDGRVELIQVDGTRFTDHRRSLYTADWKRIDVLLQFEAIAAELPPPPHLAEMIAAAERLGSGLDFIRADFYDTPARLYFGELTTTPGGGKEHFRPKEFDLYLGGLWKLPSNNGASPEKFRAGRGSRQGGVETPAKQASDWIDI